MITGGLESPSRLTWLPGAPEGLELVARVDLARWLLPVDARCRKDERADRRLARLVQVAVRALHRSQWSIGYLRLRRTDDLREQLRRCLEEIDTSGLDLPAFAVVHRRNDAGSRTGVPDHVPELVDTGYHGRKPRYWPKPESWRNFDAGCVQRLDSKSENRDKHG